MEQDIQENSEFQTIQLKNIDDELKEINNGIEINDFILQNYLEEETLKKLFQNIEWDDFNETIKLKNIYDSQSKEILKQYTHIKEV